MCVLGEKKGERKSFLFKSKLRWEQGVSMALGAIPKVCCLSPEQGEAGSSGSVCCRFLVAALCFREREVFFVKAYSHIGCRLSSVDTGRVDIAVCLSTP